MKWILHKTGSLKVQNVGRNLVLEAVCCVLSRRCSGYLVIIKWSHPRWISAFQQPCVCCLIDLSPSGGKVKGTGRAELTTAILGPHTQPLPAARQIDLVLVNSSHVLDSISSSWRALQNVKVIKVPPAEGAVCLRRTEPMSKGNVGGNLKKEPVCCTADDKKFKDEGLKQRIWCRVNLYAVVQIKLK